MDALASLVDRDSHSNSNYTAVVQSSAEHDPHGILLVAWLALQLAGQATLPFLVVTMLFRKRIARRNPTVINLCIAWTLATIPPLLLFYTGQHIGPQPDKMLCLVQAATVSATLPMASVAYISVVIHACTVVNNIISGNPIRPVSLDLRTILLMSSPYVTFLLFALLIAVVGAQHPEDIARYHFFCEVGNHHLLFPVFGFCVAVVLLTLVAQIWISVMFYRNWSAKRQERVEHGHVDLGFLFRMLFFTLFEGIILVACVATVSDPELGATKILLATPPFAVFLIFSSSPDILRAWFPCCFPRKPIRTLADVEIASQIPVATSFDEDTHRHSDAPSLLEPAMTEVRPRIYDLEIGLPPVSSSPEPREVATKTTVVVYPRSSDPEPPMRAIRAIRSPAGPRATQMR